MGGSAIDPYARKFHSRASDPVSPSSASIWLNTTVDKLKVKLASGIQALLTTADVDTDVTLAANSDARVPSQKAVKAYVDASGGGGGGGAQVFTIGYDNTVPIGSLRFIAPGFTSLSATENLRTVIIPRAGTLSKLYIKTSTSQPGDDELTIRVSVNGGAGGSLAVVIPTNSVAGTYSNTVSTQAVSAGDALTIRVSNADGTAVSANIVSISFQFE